MNFKSYLNNKTILENRSRNCIVVDVQPAYDDYNPLASKIINFVNRQTGKVLMYLNGEESGISEDTKQDVQYYWEENGFDRGWHDVRMIDKGYGYLRPWMDQDVPNEVIIRAIRLMFQYKVGDSRELFDEDIDKLKHVLNYDDIPEHDPLVVNWLDLKLLKQFDGSYIMGGGRNECLREVEIMMNAFNIKYKRIDSLVYG